MNLKPGDKFQLKGGQDWWIVCDVDLLAVQAYFLDGTHKSAFALRSINPDTIIRKDTCKHELESFDIETVAEGFLPACSPSFFRNISSKKLYGDSCVHCKEPLKIEWREKNEN